MNPLKVKASATPINSANFSGLQPMTDAEVKNYIANVITEKFAADTDGTGTAEINIDTANLLTGTSIGSFVDTVRTESIGDHPATGATTSTTYYAKQVTSVASESITNRPIKWEDNAAELSDSDIDGVMDLVIESMVSEDSYTAGQYKLQATAPSGGTWVARYTITDEAQGGNTTTYLWQKTVATSSADSDLTPLKSNNANSLKQMSVAEIEQLVPNFRNRIIDTSIGTYKFQSTTPSGGTWVQMGDTFSDTRQSIAENSYDGVAYSAGYTNTYSGTTEISYSDSTGFSGGYTNNYTGAYSGIAPAAYSGAYTGTALYAGSYGEAVFLGFYTGQGLVSYSGQYTSGPFVGPTYSSETTVVYTASYSGQYTSGPTNVAYSGTYEGPSYTSGPTYATYTGVYVSYTLGAGFISGAPPVPVEYVGPPYTGEYAGVYTGPAYAGSYTGAYGRQYTGPVYGGSYTADYVRYYTGFYIGVFTGPSYVGYYTESLDFTSQSSVPYTGSYPGPGGTYTGTYIGTTGSVYSGVYVDSYSGVYGAGATYSGTSPDTYSAVYSDSYTSTYSGDTVQATKDTVSTVKLWIRTA